MAHNDLYCDGCGVEITWAPVVKRTPGLIRLYHYCCHDCLQGLDCDCAARMEQEDDRGRTPGETPLGTD